MGGFSLWHWLVVGIIILLLFGRGRFSEMMSDVAKGIKSFKKGLSEDEEKAAEQREEPRRIEARSDAPIEGRPIEPARPVDAIHPAEPDRPRDL